MFLRDGSLVLKLGFRVKEQRRTHVVKRAA